ncbi:hypothetical protein FB567DRAFT_177279 [Paraphoma chrysanthemicola]|uniref:Uncharacterized protein n=1 Tax=Paraphoma chrysanthemicola TaxID=798071 RepID=A0A8K0W3M4_9PLEO|nr:hypothetical protein FB567DRAFT_177279 [Paraphoma chrysanthemicola]
MLPHHSFALLWFASITAAAVFHRRGSVNETAPYINVTSSSTLPSVATSSSSIALPVSSQILEIVEIVSVVSSSRDGDVQSSGLESTRATSPVAVNITTSQAASSTYFSNVVVNATQPSDAASNNSSLSSGPWTNATSVSLRTSNASCTVHVPNASIDWWYPPTYSHVVGTMTSRYANFSNRNSYTLLPPTATFDSASAVQSDFACTWSTSYMSEYDYTVTNCYDYTDKPTAAATSLIYRSAFAPFPPEGIIPVSDALSYDLYTEQPVATHPITVAPNRTVEQVSATPFVQFTAYEIEAGNRTETIQLPSAYAYPYWLKGVDQQIAATGPVPDEFLQDISQLNCDAGQLQATVTVLIVVDLFYENWPDLDPFIIHFESSVLGFDDPPVVVNNAGSTAVPFTMDDWDFGTPPSPTSVKPAVRPDPVPTTPVANSNRNQDLGDAQTTQVTVGNIGTIPVVIGPLSVVVVGTQTLQPGGPAVVVGGVTPVSLVPAATAIVVGGTNTVLLPPVLSPAQQPARPPPVITIGSSTLTPNAATQFFIAPGQTLTPGGIATVDGTVVSLAPSASFIVIGGSTQILPVPAPAVGPVATSPPQIVVGGTTVVALPQGGSNNNQNNGQNNVGSGPTFVVGGQTLSPGGQAITVSGSTLSLVPGGSSVVINGVTSAVANPPIVVPQPVITIGSDVFTPASGSGSTFVIADQTLTPGGQVTVSGTVVSLAPSASFVVVNGVTSTFANPAAQITNAPVLTIGNGIFRPLPGTGTSYLVGSSTLTPGGVVVVADTTISLAPGATALVINGRTTLLTQSNQPVVTNAPLLTIGSQTYTAISGTTFVIGGQTLTPGGTITVDGTTISLAPGATQLVYGSSGRSTTTALFPATTTRSQSITGTASPSAGASGRNGQAAATSARSGSASTSHLDCWLLSFFLAAIGWLLY